MGTRPIGDPGPCLHLLVLYQTWRRLDVQSQQLAQSIRPATIPRVQVFVRDTDRRVSRLLLVRHRAGSHQSGRESPVRGCQRQRVRRCRPVTSPSRIGKLRWRGRRRSSRAEKAQLDCQRSIHRKRHLTIHRGNVQRDTHRPLAPARAAAATIAGRRPPEGGTVGRVSGEDGSLPT